ncbi:glycosyltransferase [Flavicella marina]|uniref:glycosyltransferase n=1 Tax=Flavicella marina TaxID=1475951 RepID=UPI0012646BFB|nr:glycosyltransferase [Flavicella marina]
MKILQINTFINSRSTGKIAEDIGKLVLSKGWESFYAFGRDPRPSVSKAIKIGNIIDVFYHGIQSFLFDKHGFGSKSATKRFIKKVKKIDPDIIHIHNIHGYYLNIELFFNYLKASNKPVVWTLHDCWSYTGHCAYYSYINCKKWETECNNCPQLDNYPRSFFKDNSKDNFYKKNELFNSLENLTIVPVSKWLKKELQYSYLKNHIIKMIHNGIDLKSFYIRNECKVFDRFKISSKFVILGVANVWEKRKGLEDFIELSKKLLEDEVIFLVGLNDKQLKKIPNNIIGISNTKNIDELSEIYSNADVLFNPTWEDNFPTINLEALASGTPVVTYRTGGSVESIDDKTGFVIEQGDILAAVDKIRHIKQVSKSEYTHHCRVKAEKYYNKDIVFKEYIRIYEDLVKIKQ